MIWRETWNQADDTFCEGELKICALCGGLNLASNPECFVCAWHGTFETRPEIIRIAMDLLRRRHGALKRQFLTDSHTTRLATQHNLRGALLRMFSRTRHWLFG